jgi:hypothetical protein
MSRHAIISCRSIDLMVDPTPCGAHASDSIMCEAARHAPGFFVMPMSIIIAGRDDGRSRRHARRDTGRG